MLPQRERTWADLGDARRNGRLRLLDDAFAAPPTAAIPQACVAVPRSGSRRRRNKTMLVVRCS